MDINICDNCHDRYAILVLSKEDLVKHICLQCFKDSLKDPKPNIEEMKKIFPESSVTEKSTILNENVTSKKVAFQFPEIEAIKSLLSDLQKEKLSAIENGEFEHSKEVLLKENDLINQLSSLIKPYSYK